MNLKDNEIIILQHFVNTDFPIGAVHLSDILTIPQASVGRILLSLEQKNLLKKVQNKGRMVTEEGIDFIREHNQRADKLSTATKIIDTARVLSLKEITEVLQLRCLLEPYTAQQCAKSITKETVNELKNLQLEYQYELRHGRSGGNQDLLLHLKIAQAAGNKTIYRVLKLLLSDKHMYGDFKKMSEQLREHSLKEHDLILQALFSQDSNSAFTEMEKHLQHILSHIKEITDLKIL